MKFVLNLEMEKKEYHKSLCEVCPLLGSGVAMMECTPQQELITFRTEGGRILAMAELETNCPLEVVK